MPAALKDSQVSVRLPNDLKQRMQSYAELTGRTKSHVAMEALREYLAWRSPQIEDLRAAVQAADAGDFASDAAVREVFERLAGKGAPAQTARKAAAKPGREAAHRGQARSTGRHRA